MRYRCFICLGGPRPALEKLRARIDAKPSVIDRPARASLDLVLMSDSEDYEAVCRAVDEQGLACFVRKEAVFSEEEIEAAELVSVEGVRWLSDTFDEYEEPMYLDGGRCAACGRGAAHLREPLRLRPAKMPARRHLLRVPPALVLASSKLADLVRSERWSGVKVSRAHEVGAGVPSERYYQLEITSVLPPMDASSYERSCIPEFCERCRRLGYQLVGERPVYPPGVLKDASDWNFSSEWLAPHFVGCPVLVVRRRVAGAIEGIEKLRLAPVRLTDGREGRV